MLSGHECAVIRAHQSDNTPMPQHASPLGTTNIYAVDFGHAAEGLAADAQTAVPAVAQPNVSKCAKAADQLAARMRVVKSARFNAAERLERKQKISIFTQATVALYFIGVAVFQAVYIGQIDEATNRLLTFIQIVSSVFTLMLGLLESLNDYQMKAHHLGNCALDVSALSQELEIANIQSDGDLHNFRRRYSEALKSCPVNHSNLDHDFVRLTNKDGWARWTWVYTRYFTDVYGLYALFLSVPPLLWWLHR
jgi:SMODS and SLOG-associating 2TM effector domain family 5